MTDAERERYRHLREELGAIEHTLDLLHREEAAILAEIDTLEHDARTRQLPALAHQMVTAYTHLVSVSTLLAQASVDLQVPPTAFAPAQKPDE